MLVHNRPHRIAQDQLELLEYKLCCVLSEACSEPFTYSLRNIHFFLVLSFWSYVFLWHFIKLICLYACYSTRLSFLETGTV